ncbi:hypothetical protein [Streptomyces sp. NPDC005970]|uniref:hypothetical protein n=1 Tax=Streptomyces sp. NPDC005970 TaxID=3156723 RepID=UPI0033D49442
MSARDELLDEYGRADTAPLGALADLRQKLDAYRAEVQREGIPPLFVADYEGAELTLHLTYEAAQAACDDYAKAEAHGRCWDWRTEDGIERQFWTRDLDDAPTGYTGGAVWQIEVEPDGKTSEVTQPAELTIYRASHDSIVMGLYTTAAAARAHCEADMRWDLPSVPLDWIEDEEDGVAELVAAVGEEERPTGFVVTALEVASEYDEEADE